jgi:hypothetical protein
MEVRSMLSVQVPGLDVTPRIRTLLIVLAAILIASVAVLPPRSMEAQESATGTWEYTSILVAWDPSDPNPETSYYLWPDMADNAGSVDFFLNRYGAEAWELVTLAIESTIERTEDGFDTPIVDAVRWRAVFKRPLG